MSSCSLWFLAGTFVVGAMIGTSVGFVTLGLFVSSAFPPREGD
jgi:hypothetical protein